MNDDNTALGDATCLESDGGAPGRAPAGTVPAIPAYLRDTYWWAYLHPRSVWLFERAWVVNLILWGNMHRLTDAVLAELDPGMPGPALQVACVYGDFTRRLARHLRGSASCLHLVDVAPIQLRNARRKLAGEGNLSFQRQDSTALHYANGTFAHTVVFFLLHEQPATARRATIAEALRVTRPGGKVVFVDYHRPVRGNPLRYLMRPVLKTLEPFALDLWRTELVEWVAGKAAADRVTSRLFCGGLYQKVVVRRR